MAARVVPAQSILGSGNDLVVQVDVFPDNFGTLATGDAPGWPVEQPAEGFVTLVPTILPVGGYTGS